MAQFAQFSLISTNQKVDAEAGIIHGVCVMCLGQAKGHDVSIDEKSLTQFLALAQTHADGIKVKFGNDHKAGVEDTTGLLKNFKRDGDKIRADLHLLKTDPNFNKIVEMAKTLPNEFGLSASTQADEELIGHDKFVRFLDIFSVDIVSNPAATNGLFFSTNNKNSPMLKELAIKLGVPADKVETATEQDLLVAFEACSNKMKADAETEAEKKKKLAADADDEEKGKQGKKKFEEIEGKLTEFATKLTQLEADKKGALDLAKKAEIDGLVSEASRDGKVIPLSVEALSKMDTKDIKEMITKLPKSVQLSRKAVAPKKADGTEITDRKSPEFKAFMVNQREQGALTLGNKILQQATGLNTQN